MVVMWVVERKATADAARALCVGCCVVVPWEMCVGGREGVARRV